jgi:hypothetical protein
MFVLALIPLVLGYVLATRVVGEREGHLRLPLAYALSLSCFLFGVNALFHVLSLRSAVLATIGLMAMAAAMLWPLQASTAVWPKLGRLEAGVIIVLTLTAFFRALFWQMKYSGDDFYPHAPLMALYLRGVFPPHNPFFPDAPYLGQYGRDLSISAMSVLWGERFFAVQYVVTSINHAMTVLLAYFASRRFLRSRRQALLIVTFVFLGLNPYTGRSLLDVFGNNNTFVYLFLFLNAYLFLCALRRPRLGVTIMSALCLATYSIVYTTHHGVLVAAFPLLTLAVLIRSRRWRTPRLITSAAIMVAALTVSMVHGGTLTDFGRRFLPGAHAGVAESSPEAALISQHVRIHFPKGRIGFTAFDGTPYPLMSLRSLEETGPAAALLPVTIALLLRSRRYWALLFGLIGAVAVLVPATLDFGAYENDSYRFLFLGGIGASVALGAVLGLGLDRLSTSGRLPGRARLVTAAVIGLACSASAVTSGRALADVGRRSHEYPFAITNWACISIHRESCDPVDAAAAGRMRAWVGRGDTILTNIANEPDPDFIAHSVIGSFARAFVTGHGVRVALDPTQAVGRDVKEQAGYRAIAFWATGAMELLDDMRVDWLLLDPSRLSADVRARLSQSPRLQLAHREEDLNGGGIREVYHVERKPRAPLSVSPDLTLVSAELPPRMESGWFVRIPIVVATQDRSFSGRIRLTARIRAGTRVVNESDLVRSETDLHPVGPGHWAGALSFVSPFEPGNYEVEIAAGATSVPLRSPTGATSTLRFKVT